MGLLGLSGKEKRGSPQLAAPPLPQVLVGLGEGAGPPLSPFPLESPSWNRIGGGSPTPGQPPSSNLYIRGQGTPQDTQVDP